MKLVGLLWNKIVKWEFESGAANCREGDPAMDANMPKRILQSYFPEFPIFEDPELEPRIKQAVKDVEERNEARSKIESAIRLKVVEQAEMISKLEPLICKDKRYREVFKEKWKGRDTLEEELVKLRRIRNGSQFCLCSTEEELNDLIRSLHYRLQHESTSIAEEELLLREIKQLEGTRGKVIAIAARKAKIQAVESQNKAHQSQTVEVDWGMRRRRHAYAKKLKFTEEQCKAIAKEIESFKKDLASVNVKRTEAYERLVELIKQRDKMNAFYSNYCLLLEDARKHAAEKDIAALERTEVEKFISRWNTDKSFWDCYVPRLFPSLDSNRQFDTKPQ